MAVIAKESQNNPAIVLITTALISAIATIAVAFIAIVPQLRSSVEAKLTKLESPAFKQNPDFAIGSTNKDDKLFETDLDYFMLATFGENPEKYTYAFPDMSEAQVNEYWDRLEKLERFGLINVELCDYSCHPPIKNVTLQEYRKHMKMYPNVKMWVHVTDNGRFLRKLIFERALLTVK